MNATTDTKKFELWAIVELFGHAKIAGMCTEQNIAGTNMLRVDVPETKGQPALTRFLGGNAIYAINPVDEATARYMCDKLEIKPIESWNIGEVMKKHTQLTLIDGVSSKESNFTDGLDDDDDINSDQNGLYPGN